MSELKKCPFCGGTEIEFSGFSIVPEVIMSCSNCGVMFDEESVNNQAEEELVNIVIERWNTRPIEDTLQSRINKACEMALLEMGVYADAEFKDLPESLVAFRNIIDVLQGKGE
jgi:Lar family restriction alleviation protein